MTTDQQGAPAAPFARVRDEQELEQEYAAYRTRQARLLVRMLPPEVVRPLYRRAVAVLHDADGTDPLGLLLRYCASILPLPPLDVWRADRDAHPREHLKVLDDSADAPTAASPATLEARQFNHEGRGWIAHLRAYREADVWRGHIAFRDASSGAVHHTATIFRESVATDVRERFLGFEDETMEAFLRSART